MKRNRMVRASAQPKELTLNASAVVEFVEAKAGEAPARPTFTIDAYNGGLMKVGGFYRPVIIDLAGLRIGANTPILLDHDPSQIVGQGKASISNSSVKIAGTVTGSYDSSGDPAHKVVSHAKGGFVWAASVGVGIDQLESLAEGTSATVNGNEVKGPAMIVRKGRLAETSFVAVGADESASAKVAASAAGDSDMEFSQWLQAEYGLDAATIDDKVKAKFMVKFKAAMAEEGDDEPDVKAGKKAKPTNKRLAQIAADAREKRDRQNRIAEIAAEWIADRPDDLDDIEAAAKEAIEANQNPDDFEREMLKAMRAKPTVGLIHDKASGVDATAEMFECALCAHGGMSDLDTHFDEKIINASRKQWKHGLSLGEFLQAAARRNGHGTISGRDVKGLLEGAFGGQSPRMLRAGFSSLDIDGVLSNVANKFLMMSFMAVENSWAKISAMKSVKDFKENTTYRLTGDNQYEKVSPGGEIKHGTMSETSYTNKADTYGKILAVTRNDIVNDDLGALIQIGRILGRGGALKINDVFWTEWLADNSTFYTTGRGNYTTGATTVLSPTSLKSVVALFKKLKDDDNKPMGVLPRILLVPAELEVDAEILTGSIDTRQVPASSSGTNDALAYGTLNPFRGKYNVVASAYLSDTAYTGYSTTAWWLMADPNDVPVIETCFLNGQQSPIVESADADFNVLGIRIRAYHDFGVKKQEYRGAVKSKGAA